MRTIKQHDSGPAVAYLQYLLTSALPFSNSRSTKLNIDGLCGGQTVAAIKAFQQIVKLATDGVAGAQTWSKLFDNKGIDKVLELDDSGPQVKYLQQALNERLGPTIKLSVDAHLGGKTRKAIMSLQAESNIAIDGEMGPKSWQALDTMYTGKKIPQTIVIPAVLNGPWMTVAQKELGQAEISGTEHNPQIIKYHATTTYNAKTDETPWCSSFVNWVLIQAGYQGTNSAAAASWLKWGQAVGAKTGAIAVIYNAKSANSSLSSSGNHVGFLVEETATHYKLLGGNQGNRVKISSFPKKSWTLKGYRYPKTQSAQGLSSQGKQLLKDIEELRLSPYDDQSGKVITAWVEGATIGYGHLIARGDWSRYANGITKAQADILFTADLAPFVSVVERTVTRALSQQQLDALVLLAYNIGQSGFSRSSVVKLINDPSAKTDYNNVESAWKAFNKSQGKINNGLINRRQAEWDIYSQGVYKKW